MCPFHTDGFSVKCPSNKDTSAHADDPRSGHLIDVYLLAVVPLNTESERQRKSNPRKIHSADPGLIHAFASSGRPNLAALVDAAKEQPKAAAALLVQTEEQALALAGGDFAVRPAY
jgi:hypothetical protein